MMPSMQCYMPSSVELLLATASQFSNPDPRDPSFQTRLTPLAPKERCSWPWLMFSRIKRDVYRCLLNW